jgi:hypothetical protein
MDELDEAIYTAMMYGKARRFDQILRLNDISHDSRVSERRGGAAVSSDDGVSMSFRGLTGLPLRDE